MTTPFRVRHGLIANVSSNTQSAIVASNQVLTGSTNTSLVDLATTWNTSGTPTAFRLNVTDTASAAGSLLMDLQVGGASRFRVDKSGDVIINGGTVTTSSPVIDAAQTWNAGAVTFTGLKLNITRTAAADASYLFNFQTNGSDCIYGVSGISNIPELRITRGTVAPSTYLALSCFAGTATFNHNSADADFSFLANSVSKLYFYPAGNKAAFASNVGIGWSATTTATGTFDTILTRRAAASLRLGASDTSASATITVTIASPGVVTWSSHGLTTGTPVVFSTDGALPTGITAGTTYYAIVVNTTTFQLATSFANALAGTAVNTSGSQSGTHTGRRGAIAQTLGVQDTLSTSSLENIDGADFVIRGSRSIGNKPGGSIIFQVAPAGSTGTAQNALATALTIASTTDVTFAANAVITGRFFINPDLVGNDYFYGSNFYARSSVRLASGIPLGWSSSATLPNVAADLTLFRDAANTLALRNGANAQAFNIYNTFTDASNYERLRIDWASIPGRVTIGPQWAGTGTAKNLYFAVQSGGFIFLQPNGATSFGKDGTGSFWDISSAGHFLASSDNTYDIGAAGATRPRNVFVAGLVYSSIETPNNGYVSFGAEGRITGTGTDGVFRLQNNAGNNFGRLQFGGFTSSFPALKRDSATLQVRLADDSAFTNIQGKITTETAYTAGAPTATGYLVLYDSNGTAYKVPAEALA